MKNQDAVKDFSSKFIVDEKLVEKYLKHLEELELKKKKRMESRQRIITDEMQKTFTDYNWVQLYRESKIQKLKVSILDLYILEKSLKFPKGMLKQGKVDIVSADIARCLVNLPLTECSDVESDDEEQDDVVIEEIGNGESDDESDDESEDESDDESDYESDGESDSHRSGDGKGGGSRFFWKAHMSILVAPPPPPPAK